MIKIRTLWWGDCRVCPGVPSLITRILDNQRTPLAELSEKEMWQRTKHTELQCSGFENGGRWPAEARKDKEMDSLWSLWKGSLVQGGPCRTQPYNGPSVWLQATKQVTWHRSKRQLIYLPSLLRENLHDASVAFLDLNIWPLLTSCLIYFSM